MGFDKDKSCRDRTFADRILNVFVCSSGTNSHRVKLRAQLDSAPQLRLGSTSHEFFDCSGGLSKGGQDGGCGILTVGKSGTFCLVAPQPRGLQTNGGYHRIQHT